MIKKVSVWWDHFTRFYELIFQFSKEICIALMCKIMTKLQHTFVGQLNFCQNLFVFTEENALVIEHSAVVALNMWTSFSVVSHERHDIKIQYSRFKSIYSTMYRHQSYKSMEQYESKSNISWWVLVWRPSLRLYGRYHKGHQELDCCTAFWR